MIEAHHVVVGAGVVGLAIAAALVERHAGEVIVLEAETAIGTGVSSRNSEVIHGGLYYPPDSLKAITCVRGRELLYAYAKAHRVPHRQTGKLVVATEEAQIEALLTLRDNAAASGAGELALWSPDRVADIEPAVSCCAALWSPRSGIVDSHALVHALARDVRDGGGLVVCRSPAAQVHPEPGALVVEVRGDDPARVRCRHLYIAAGFGTLDLLRRLELPPGLFPEHPTAFAKGNYFDLVGSSPPFSRLIYPLPEPGGLGIHATVDLAGQVRFGPDVEWVEELDYRPNEARAELFYDAVRKYWPALPDGALNPSYAGIRPKLGGRDAPSADYRIAEADEHGIEGLTALIGIESPGLTSALALAERLTRHL
ncbi:MAG: NAD(P)/FAD-dependent oxidoreductase [Myxococcota bacterium]